MDLLKTTELTVLLEHAQKSTCLIFQKQIQTLFVRITSLKKIPKAYRSVLSDLYSYMGRHLNSLNYLNVSIRHRLLSREDNQTQPLFRDFTRMAMELLKTKKGLPYVEACMLNCLALVWIQPTLYPLNLISSVYVTLAKVIFAMYLGCNEERAKQRALDDVYHWLPLAVDSTQEELKIRAYKYFLAHVCRLKNKILYADILLEECNGYSKKWWEIPIGKRISKKLIKSIHRTVHLKFNHEDEMDIKTAPIDNTKVVFGAANEYQRSLQL